MRLPKVCLVTGGAGFLGSFLCEQLLSRGDTVVCWDNLSTGSLQNVAHLRQNNRFTFVQHDVAILRRLPDGVENIFNLACPASPVQYRRDPIQTMKTNVLGALNLLSQGLTTRARFLQASTSEIYGDPLVHPQSETYWGNVNSMGPRACYDEGKRAAETLFYDYHHTHGVDVRVARIFNTYGPRMSCQDGRVISNFIVQALRGEALTLYGDGSQTRSFCYRDDLVEGLLALMNSDQAPARAINLGNPEEITMQRLAELVLAQIDSEGSIRYVALPQDDPTQRQPDASAAKAILGWAPKITLEEGLSRTITYFRNVLAR